MNTKKLSGTKEVRSSCSYIQCKIELAFVPFASAKDFKLMYPTVSIGSYQPTLIAEFSWVPEVQVVQDANLFVSMSCSKA